ncbi:F-box protein SKIP24 [Carex littledalei]|uniref:F-box protein SKIP24 n=1 Tax=Carex littledalei TaxID=544730 RepID=A0A833RA16_9POAL|nr:F-box protein SKIP24 [Carex littledalei]
MSSLPDDVWVRVLEFGTERRLLDYRDLCRLARVNSKFNQLSSHPSLWATLLSHDSSHYPSSHPPSKSLYRKKLEEEQMAELEARRSSRTDLYPSELLFNIIDAYCHHPGETSVNIPNSTGPGNPPQDCITDQRTSRLHKLKRGCNIGPKPKAIPNSRYYVPLNKPRRQAMPRKI